MESNTQNEGKALEEKFQEGTMPGQQSGMQNAQQNSLMIPGAIVIAGIIIALAVVGGKGQQDSQAEQAPLAAKTATPPSAPNAAPQAGTVKPVSTDEHILGNPNAQVFLIEYSDFECPFCKRFHPTTKQILEAYKDKVALVYRHFPLGFHANAQKEAEASECAAELGGNDAFWKFTDAIYERTTSNGTGFALTKLAPLAKELGLDEAKFKTCLDGGKYAKKVQQDMAEGVQAGVNGTPGNILWTKNGVAKLMPGALPFEMFKQELDQLVK